MQRRCLSYVIPLLQDLAFQCSFPLGRLLPVFCRLGKSISLPISILSLSIARDPTTRCDCIFFFAFCPISRSKRNKKGETKRREEKERERETNSWRLKCQECWWELVIYCSMNQWYSQVIKFICITWHCTSVAVTWCNWKKQRGRAEVPVMDHLHRLSSATLWRLLGAWARR